MPKSKLTAITQSKCPRCREGDVFKQSLLKKPFSPLDTHEKCPVCQFRYEIEPGFWWAGLYISYAFNVAVMIAVLVALNVFNLANTALEYIIPVIGAMLLVYPYNMRYARIILLHFFAGVDYDSKFTSEKPSR